MAVKQEISPDKVAIYIRWSTEDQGEGTTLDVQMDGCRHYVLSQGWAVRPDLIFIDDGYSGGTLDRPGMTRLREKVKQGEIECVVVYKLDRLSRSVSDTARLCMDEWEGICCVKSAREPIDTNSQAGKMFFYTLMNYAEWERTVIRDRLHSGRVRRAQEGKSPGISVIPFGYTQNEATGAFEVVPHEAAIVQRLFEAYRGGAGVSTIANTLNREGISFRDGRQWRSNTISYMLSNRAYIGDLVWGLRARNPRHAKRPGEKAIIRRDEPLVIREGVFPPIISRDEFLWVQAIKQERPTVGRGGGRSIASDYLLTGILRCGLCGSPMVGQHNDKRRKNGYYYSCTTRRDRGAAVCPASSIQCCRLEGVVVDKLMELYGSAGAQERCIQMLTRDSVGKCDVLRAELVDIDRRLAKLSEKDRRLLQQYNNDELTVTEFRDLRAALSAEIEPLRSARESAEIRLRSLEASTQNNAYLAEQVGQLVLWDELNVPQRKNLLRQFVDRISASKNDGQLSCDITWKVSVENLV